MPIEISKGLDLPIQGQPIQAIEPGKPVSQVALIADDYVGMKPKLLAQVGDSVKIGQPLFEDKKNPGVLFTSPAAGKVHSINRGEKRKFLSMIIDVDGGGMDIEKEARVSFQKFDSLEDLDRETAEQELVASGLWTGFRTRPYSKAPALGSSPSSIFVTAMDTNPLSAEPELVIANETENFVSGLTVITKFTEGKVFVCTRNDSRTPGDNVPNVVTEEFHGPHPAGLPGTHIHFLDPVGPNKTVWHINYQDVIAIGHLFRTGELKLDRVVAIAGPRVAKPGLYRTRMGAKIDDLTAGLIDDPGKGDAESRLVSGSVLCGRTVEEPVNFLGRHDLQVSALEEGTKREFFGWQKPGFNKFSITRIYAGAFGAGKRFKMNTNINGGHRSMVPVGTYERIMPLDVLPTQLLRALIVNDTDQAQALGCLELSEEDLALCTYVCPGKYDFGTILRENLTMIEKEG